ncbi:unnamed protein product [Angiostrongylus costaricensis]|uniref:Epoxide hydrolase n=1 Tax=Angiostrongylus costaricensis TaxID=334426 RepID=A0A0R3PFT0_ANGCS|nr:unnamed protein product [Angiostrongylus costaricensis]
MSVWCSSVILGDGIRRKISLRLWNEIEHKKTVELHAMKGGGHFVPTDRPGQALQMFHNFGCNKGYSTPLTLNLSRQPLLEQYKPIIPTVPRMKADMIFALSGLIFKPDFHQHSDYLRVSPHVLLHYW